MIMGIFDHNQTGDNLCHHDYHKDFYIRGCITNTLSVGSSLTVTFTALLLLMNKRSRVEESSMRTDSHEYDEAGLILLLEIQFLFESWVSSYIFSVTRRSRSDECDLLTDWTLALT